MRNVLASVFASLNCLLSGSRTDWNALVVDRSHGVLTVAKRRSGFVELAECGRSSAVVASPPGWRVVSQEDDAEWSEPILAWIVADSGVGQPMIADRVSGYIACAEDFSAKYALWGPDDPEPPTTVTGCAQQK